MKREYMIIFIIALFILGYVLDLLAGPLNLDLKNPFDFLQPRYLNAYPFTAVSIGVKIAALFISILLALSFIEKKYLAKGIFLFFLGAMMELYTIQQIATLGSMISVVWSVALAFTGVLLFLPAVIFFITGLLKLSQKMVQDNVTDPYGLAREGESEDEI